MNPRKRKLGRCLGLDVWLVDGEMVRNHVDIDFTCGGHGVIYPDYIPDGEIWIDDALGPLDATATLLHEVVEYDLMRHRRWGYDRAHDVASHAEAPFRLELERRRPRAIDIRAVERRFAKIFPEGLRRLV